MPHSIRKLLLDITLASEEIGEFVEGKAFTDFQKDRILQLALEREFEIIGEALARLERLDKDKLSQKIPEYIKIIGFRNLVAHGYDVIDDASLWDFAINLVPELLDKIQNY
jgi:uncharacterized protein with HEPN domain